MSLNVSLNYSASLLSVQETALATCQEALVAMQDELEKKIESANNLVAIRIYKISRESYVRETYCVKCNRMRARARRSG